MYDKFPGREYYNMKKKEGNMFRQGDVLLRRIDTKATGKKQDFVNGNEVVVEYGEVTGHHHHLTVLDTKAPEVSLYLDEQKQFLEVCAAKGSALKHEEHDTIVLPKGTYVRHEQNTWSVTEQMAKRVID